MFVVAPPLAAIPPQDAPVGAFQHQKKGMEGAQKAAQRVPRLFLEGVLQCLLLEELVQSRQVPQGVR